MTASPPADTAQRGHFERELIAAALRSEMTPGTSWDHRDVDDLTDALMAHAIPAIIAKAREDQAATSAPATDNRERAAAIMRSRAFHIGGAHVLAAVLDEAEMRGRLGAAGPTP